MQLLTALTIGYAAVLVMALVAVLSVAAWRLVRVARALEDAGRSLQATAQATRALETGLKPLHDLSQQLAHLWGQHVSGEERTRP
jgi:cytochrome c oxidase assembly factor CtaG